MLYFRMLLNLAISLYTVRVVLDVLGPVDYGLFNVVGGIVSLLAFLNGTMAAASQRFFAYELGKKNYSQVERIFGMTLLIYGIIAILVLLFSETVGLWFLNSKMSIPSDRLIAANWIYQFSIATFIISILTVPYNALIIANEKMEIYAYVSIVEVILKLLIVYALLLFNIDKLKLYGILTFVVTLIISLIYIYYCRKKMSGAKFSFKWNRELFKEIVSYSGWNLFGAIAGVFNNHGVNILLNLFFGPLVNASRTIAYQVNSAISFFVSNFVIAARPQITKSYAAGENDKMLELVFSVSKFAYLLLFILSMPIILEVDFVLKSWLNEVPTYSNLFVRLVVICSLVDSLSYPLMTAAQATGKVQRYQTVVGGMLLLNLPVSYTFFKFGFPAESVFYVSIVNSVICLFLRLQLLKRMVQLPLKAYLRSILLPITKVSILSYLFPLVLYHNMHSIQPIFRFMLVSVVSGLSCLLCVYFIGLSGEEKAFLWENLRKIKKRVSMRPS